VRYQGALQLVKPDVADSSAVPFTPKLPLVLVFSPLTKFSTPGLAVAAMPSMPNVLTFGSVPCLRRLMPGEVVPVPLLVLPAVVLPLISRQSVVSP
jgi:hypothetical protein